MNQYTNTTSTVQFGLVRSTGDVIAYYSDERLKDIEGKIESALEKVMELDGIYYRSNKLAEQFGYIDKQRHIGVIAQQVKKHFPEIIRQAPFDTDGDKGASITGEDYITVQYEKLVAILIEAIKELNDKVDKLSNK